MLIIYQVGRLLQAEATLDLVFLLQMTSAFLADYLLLLAAVKEAPAFSRGITLYQAISHPVREVATMALVFSAMNVIFLASYPLAQVVGEVVQV